MPTDQMELTERLAALRGDWKREDFTIRQQVAEKKILVLADVHVPYHDERLLADALCRAEMQQVEAIVWLGDLMDNPTFSSWGVDDLSTTFRRELDIVEGIVREAAKVVKKQYWSSGNHEQRWMRRNGGQVDMELLARNAGLDDLVRSGHLVISDNPALEYMDGRWLLAHPGDYSGNPLAVPGILADKEDKHVVCGHAHHWAKGKSPSGKYTVVESGCLLNPSLIKYVQHRPSRHRAWTQGYVLLDHGQAILIDGTAN